MAFKFSNLLGKKDDYPAEYKRFKKALAANPNDQGLKSQFIRFCLLNRFTGGETSQENVAEALRLFEAIQGSPSLDLQCHYMVGKYYQEERDFRKAYGVYLTAIKRFNGYVANPDLKSENSELAYSLALNLMTLQSDPVDPEVEVCFKIIRKSFPLHLKRIQYENEMAKPAPDPTRIKKLAEEIRQLRAEDEKETSQAAAGAGAAPQAASSNPHLSPDPSGVASAKPDKPADKPAEKNLETPASQTREPLFSSSSQIQDAKPAVNTPAAGPSTEPALGSSKGSGQALSNPTNGSAPASTGKGSGFAEGSAEPLQAKPEEKSKTPLETPVSQPVRHSGSTELAGALGEAGNRPSSGLSGVASAKPDLSGAAARLGSPEPLVKGDGEGSRKEKGIFSKLFNELSPGALGLAPTGLETGTGGKATGHGRGKETLHISPQSESGDASSTFMAYHEDRWEGPFTSKQLQSMGFLKPATWVCRSGSQQVLQAYEVPDLQPLFQG